MYADNSQPGMDESGKLAEYTGADIMKETRDTLMANMELYGPMKAGSEAQALKYFKDLNQSIRISTEKTAVAENLNHFKRLYARRR